MSMKEAAGRVAAESSNGTWSTLSTLTSRINEMRGRCYSIKGNHILVAYPEILFENGSIPQLLSAIAGNIFGMKAVKNLRLDDIILPKNYIKHFRGPEFGIHGVRKFMKEPRRPMLCTVPKPKVGMNTKEHTNVGKEIWTGGVDFLKDDENLTDQRFNKFNARAEACFKVRDKVEKEVGEKRSYFINITGETNEMIKRAKVVKKLGGEYVMIDIVTVGFAALQTLREECHDLKLAIHAHRAMHAAFDRNPKHGMSMYTLGKLARLVGVDNLHVGTVVGKLVGTQAEVNRLIHEMKDENDKKISRHDGAPVQHWGKIKPVIPVSSGGLHPGIMPYVYNLFGNDCVIQLGGGMHGHPQGSRVGAIATRQALDAVMHHVPLTEAAKRQEALALALQKWGTTKTI